MLHLRAGEAEGVVTARVYALVGRSELNGRIQLALSLIAHRGHSEATSRLVERALRGESIEQLAADERRTTEGA